MCLIPLCNQSLDSEIFHVTQMIQGKSPCFHARQQGVRPAFHIVSQQRLLIRTTIIRGIHQNPSYMILWLAASLTSGNLAIEPSRDAPEPYVTHVATKSHMVLYRLILKDGARAPLNTCSRRLGNLHGRRCQLAETNCFFARALKRLEAQLVKGLLLPLNA